MLRIAHLSDFHLRHHLPGTSAVPRRLSRRMPGLIEEAVQCLRREAPDVVAVTGDLLDYPLYDLHEGALADRGTRDLELIRELFEPLTCPVAFLYGNHDHPGLFREVFRDQPTELEVKGHRIFLFFDDEVRHNIPQRMGTERERFLAALADADPRPQIHLQHYLTAPEMDHGYPMNYAEAESMRAALEADPRARLVLSGHYHQGISPFMGGSTWYATAPAFCERPHAFQLLTFDGEEVRSNCVSLETGPEPRRKAVFLDRDGNINPQPAYHTGPDPFILIDGVGLALRRLQEAGYALVVVTNQTAVAHGFVTESTVASVNDKMARLLEPHGVFLDAVVCRYHAANAIVPRYRTATPETKPSPAMLQQAADSLGLDLAASFIVGDQVSDLEAGRNAGCRASVLVRTGHGERHLSAHGASIADHVADDLPGAVDWILRQSR